MSLQDQKGMPYDFSWAVKDEPSNNDYAHEETSDGQVVTGSYRVLLPDGRTQIVTYRVEGDSGFVAEVKYEGEAKTETTPTYRPTANGVGASTPAANTGFGQAASGQSYSNQKYEEQPAPTIYRQSTQGPSQGYSSSSAPKSPKGSPVAVAAFSQGSSSAGIPVAVSSFVQASSNGPSPIASSFTQSFSNSAGPVASSSFSQGSPNGCTRFYHWKISNLDSISIGGYGNQPSGSGTQGSGSVGGYGNQGSGSPGGYGNQGSGSSGSYGNQGSGSSGSYGNQGSGSSGSYGNQGSGSAGGYANQGSGSVGSYGNQSATGSYGNQGNGQGNNQGLPAPAPEEPSLSYLPPTNFAGNTFSRLYNSRLFDSKKFSFEEQGSYGQKSSSAYPAVNALGANQNSYRGVRAFHHTAA